MSQDSPATLVSLPVLRIPNIR